MAGKYRIVLPPPPTEEEMYVNAEVWWHRLYPTTFLAWNQALVDSAIPFACVKVPDSLAGVMASVMMDGRQVMTDGRQGAEAMEEGLSSLVDETMSANGWDKVFVKLISRSPKDWMDADQFGKPLPVLSGAEAATSLMGSMRVFDDMCMLMQLPGHTQVVVRPYEDFHAGREFRVLVREGNTVGISQYYYSVDFGYAKEFLANAEAAIRRFVGETVTPNMLVTSFVADVVVGEGGTSCRLLETNPYGISDPCLFVSYDKLDGSFKTKVD